MVMKMRNLDSLKGFELGAQDGNIGKCKDFLFDDKVWVIRYLVANTRKWLPGRKVLISPISVGTVDSLRQIVNVSLSRDQIKNGPALDSDAPVSRQYETFFNRYFDWSDYWQGSGMWGEYSYPRSMKIEKDLLDIEQDPKAGPNLRSTEEVSGYRIHARDDDIGHVEDYLIEEDSWAIRYLVIDTSNWIPGSKRVIVNPNWVDAVDWADRSLELRMTKEQVESSPQYDPQVGLNRDHEKAVFDHYNYPYYW